ncbi:MAG: type II secretion system F family protein [archaeon]
MKFLERYQIYLYGQKIKIPALYWLLMIFGFSLVLGAIGYLISPKIGFLLFVVILDLGYGIPIYLYDKHIKEIERYWPDALKLIADTMKAGSSFDYALREVCVADFGPLSFEINEVIRRIEMGDTTIKALYFLSYRVESKVDRRTVTLVQESLRTGAPLADVLEEIANDTKYIYRIKKERQTKTMLQSIFIVAAGAVVAPFIFGLTRVITEFLTNVATSTGIASAASLVVALKTQETIFMLLDIYIILEVFAASAMISIMREGKLSPMYVFFPVMITIAYTVYLVAQAVLRSMLAGMV